ncbi:hypothetical protein EV363DRAFT_1457581 [Boletus edulis]|nr:hypothetical protein EV363DRAFT_1457581 [Boletus edulis]
MEQPPSPRPIVTRRTRPGNADKRPGLILYETGTVQRRHTKAEKAANDQRLQEAKTTKDKAADQGIDQLALLEMEAEASAKEAKAKKAAAPPPRPRPHMKTKETGSGSGEKAKICETDGQKLHQPVTPAGTDVSKNKRGNPVDAANKKDQPSNAVEGRSKVMKSLPPSLKDTIKLRKGKLAAEVTKKLSVGGQVKNWRAGVTAEVDVSPVDSGMSVVSGPPPSSTYLTSNLAQSSATSHTGSAVPIPIKAPHGRTQLANPSDEIFGDTVDDKAEKEAVTRGSNKLIAVTPASEDEDDILMPYLPSQPRVHSATLKRKSGLGGEEDDEDDDISMPYPLFQPRVRSLPLKHKSDDEDNVSMPYPLSQPHVCVHSLVSRNESNESNDVSMPYLPSQSRVHSLSSKCKSNEPEEEDILMPYPPSQCRVYSLALKRKSDEEEDVESSPPGCPNPRTPFKHNLEHCAKVVPNSKFRSVDHEDGVMDIDGPEVALNVTKAKGHGSRLTKAMSVGVKMESKGIKPPHKKLKAEMSTPSTVPDSVSTGSISGSQERTCDKDGYVIDVVKKRSEISDIYDYVVAGRTSLPPPASPPRSPIAGPSTDITFPDIFHLVPEEAVRSESYDPNDYNPSDYEVQIKREETDLQEQDQLADYDSSLDQGYRTLVNRTTLAPEDAPSTIVRATSINTADLPGQLARTNAVWTEDRLSPTNADRDLVYPPIGSPIYNPSTPTRAPSELPEPIDWEPIYHRLTRLRTQHSPHHRNSTPAAPRESELEASIVRAIREGIELGRQQTRDLARIERARREVQQAADRIEERIRIRERTPTPIPHIPDLPRWFRIPDSRLYVSVLISRTVSEYIEINETPETIQIRPENPEPQPQRPVRDRAAIRERQAAHRRTIQQRIRQAQLAALAEQEAAAEAGEPLPPPQRTLRIPAPTRRPDLNINFNTPSSSTLLAPRNSDFKPEQADHSALESESSENLNYPA